MATKAFSKARIEVSAQDKTKKAFGSIQGSLKSVTGTLFSLQSAVISAAGIGGMGMLIKSSLEAADGLAKAADRINITTESLGGLRHAANLAGMENDALDTSLEKLNINLSKAARTGGAAADALEDLGLNAETLALMPTDEAVGVIADAMVDVESSADRARIAQDLFGRSGLDMINVLSSGSEGLKEAADEADALGLSLSRVDAAKIEAANDAITKAQAAIKGVGLTITAELAPYIEAAANLFVKAAKDAGGWKDQILGAVESVIMGVARLMDVIQGLRFAFYAIQTAFSKVAEWIMKGIETIAKPIVKLLSLIPKLGISYKETMESIEAVTANVTERTGLLFEKMEAVAFEGSASEKAMEYFEQVKEAATEAAVLLAEEVAERQETEREVLENHLDGLLDITEDHSKDIVKNKKKELSDLEKFTAMSYGKQTAFVLGEVEAMTRGVAQQSMAMFRVNQAAGIANAIVNAHVAATQSLAAYPMPLGGIMAGLAYAVGLSQVMAIKSASFGGGSTGAAPSASGSSGSGTPVYDPNQGGGGTQAATPAEPVQEVKEINVNLQGAGYSKEDVRELMFQINEEVGDGVILRAS